MNDIASLAGVNLGKLSARIELLTNELLAPTLEVSKRQALQKELAFLTTILRKAQEIVSVHEQRAALGKQKETESDAAFAELIEAELVELAEQARVLDAELETLLFPPDEVDDRSVFLEIRAGTGGQEAALFAADLLRMYMLYAAKKGWKASLVHESSTDLGGYREVVVEIAGKGVYGHLKHESGVHRVQRVPATETAGRVHTSTATVVVLPEADEVDVSIAPGDLRIDVYRASGAGGQHVNTTDSAVRITHIPTGVVVACQDERSQHKNKAKALKILASRLLAAQQEKQEAQASQKRKEMVGGALRSEKARTYNFPQNRITDHQVDVTLKNLDVVMEGNLDPIIDALMKRDAQLRREKSALSV